MPTPLFEVRLFAAPAFGLPVDNSTPYRVLPAKTVGPARWRITRLDGYADAEITLNGALSVLPGIVSGRCVEFWGMNRSGVKTRLYRGYITYIAEQHREMGTTAAKSIRQTVVTIHGAWLRRKRDRVMQRYALGDGTDVGALFARVAGRWTKNVAPKIVIDGRTVGQAMTYLDAWRKTLGDVATELVDATGGFAVSGGDVDPVTGRDRIYLRPFGDPQNAVSITLPDPGKSVLDYNTEQDSTQIANAVDIVGGKHRFPNLLAQACGGNTSFEYPSYVTADTIGNLLVDGGFDGIGYPPGVPIAPVAVSNITISNEFSGNSGVFTPSTPASPGFSVQYVLGTLTITGGTGFVPGDYRILQNVNAGAKALGLILMLAGKCGTLGSTGGTGTLSALDAWTLTGGAAVRPRGDVWGETDGGDYMIELPGQGDAVMKPFAADASRVIPGQPYRFRARMRLRVGTSGAGVGNRARLQIVWLNSTGAAIGTPQTASFDNTSGLDSADSFQSFTLDSVCPAGAVKGRCSVVFDFKPAAAPGGILVDSLSFSGARAVVQSGWEIFPRGSASVQEIDWAYEGAGIDSAYHGAYSLRIAATSTDVDEQDIAVRPHDNPAIGVTVGQQVVFSAWAKTTQATAAGGGTRPKIQMQIFQFNAQNEYLRVVKADCPADPGIVWKQLSVSCVIPGDCRTVRVSLVLRGTGTTQLDALELRDSGALVASSAAGKNSVFIEGDTYTQFTAAVDAFDPASPVAGSEATYSRITDLVDEKSVATERDGNAFAAARLARTSLPFDRPQVQTIGYAYDFYPGVYLHGIGADGLAILPVPLPIVEVEGEWDGRGLLKLRPITNTERPSETRVTREIVRKALVRDGGNSGGSGGGGTSAGSLTFGGTTGTTSLPAHAPTHATGGSDPVMPVAIGAEPALGVPAADGYVLSSSHLGVRAWVPPSGGAGTFQTTEEDASAFYQVANLNSHVVADCYGGNINVTLPVITGAGDVGKTVTVVRQDSFGANSGKIITVVGGGPTATPQTIRGTLALRQLSGDWQSVTLRSARGGSTTGYEWHVISKTYTDAGRNSLNANTSAA